VVDNCEHVIDLVAELIDVLLERAPGIRVIATSRESLEIEGEFTWRVPSLATGDDAPAVELFLERAAAAGGGSSGTTPSGQSSATSLSSSTGSRSQSSWRRQGPGACP
jgi:hypothetical protein